MGFRNISKQLEKEGLAKISKSTVENRWKQTQNQIIIATRNPFNNAKLNALAKQEAKLQNKVTYSQMLAEALQRIQDLQIQRSETPEGLQDIFKTKKELKEFTLQALYDSEVLKAFILRCKIKRVQLAEAIAEAVGSLDEYVVQQEEIMGHLNLAGYIEERLEDCLNRERQDQLEKPFREHLLNFKCSNCNHDYFGMWIDISEAEIVCSCGYRYKPLCTACGNELDFDNAKDAFFCRKCHAKFRLPTLKPSDFTFIKEPAQARHALN